MFFWGHTLTHIKYIFSHWNPLPLSVLWSNKYTQWTLPILIVVYFYKYRKFTECSAKQTQRKCKCQRNFDGLALIALLRYVWMWSEGGSVNIMRYKLNNNNIYIYNSLLARRQQQQQQQIWDNFGIIFVVVYNEAI